MSSTRPDPRRMLPKAQWHRSITIERTGDAVEREMLTLDNPGFCLVCGVEAMECEPDARFYRCQSCGECQVFGANELFMHMVPP